MYAIVEFMSSEEEVSSNELAIVPLLWLHKQEKKCYWPITTKKTPFPQFVKNQTPMKKTWPSYTVYKIHFKTDIYEKAEEKLKALLEGSQLEQESLSNASSYISFVKKNLDDSESHDSDNSDSKSEDSSPPRKNRNLGFQPINTSLNVSSMNTPINNKGTNSPRPTLNKLSTTTLGPAESPIPSFVSEPEVSPLDTRTHMFTSASTNSTKTGSTVTESTVSASRASGSTLSCVTPQLTPTSSENNMGDVSYEYLQEVLNITTKIQTEVENHSVILHELLRQNRKINADKLIAPSNLPTFPIREHDIFLTFNDLLSSDDMVYDYMVKRLAAVGGGSIQSHTRRILKHIMSDDVAVLYNWKGRDKHSFQKTSAMTLIYEAAKLNYPNEERNDLSIENAVKDYLKFAKSRLNSKKK